MEIMKFPKNVILTSDFIIGDKLVYCFTKNESWYCAFIVVLMC